MPTLRVLKSLIDHNFCPPFMEKGIVQTTLWPAEEGGEAEHLQITIGQRDVEFLEDGTQLGAGTSFTKRIGFVEGEADGLPEGVEECPEKTDEDDLPSTATSPTDEEIRASQLLHYQRRVAETGPDSENPIDWDWTTVGDFVEHNYWYNAEDAIGDIRLFLTFRKHLRGNETLKG